MSANALDTTPFALDEATHTYTVRGARRPGVSEILAGVGVTSDLERIPEALRAKAKARGSAVHLATLYDDGGELDFSSVDEHTMGCVESWRAMCRHVEWQATMRERVVWSEKFGYAGTLDAFGMVWGAPTVLDIKGGVYRGAGPQTAAYFEALREHGFAPVRRAVVTLYPSGRPGRIRPMTDPEDWTCFLSALNLYHWKSKHGA